MLRSGQRMVRADDGMRGVVETVVMPDFERFEELRIVYYDRGERRIAPKREEWHEASAPPKKLRPEEICTIARVADQLLRCIDLNEPMKWWDWGGPGAQGAPYHDPAFVNQIVDYLQKRV